ncbi:MAG TPA: hypothetical protein VM120_02390 [Bryobacteraceae bacterium]|nr:hypothetical protein [Bryobacteraceae bacterium]
MKLAELRRLTIKKQLRIRFKLPNGMECLIDEHGLAKVPALKNLPDFNLEQDLAQATAFQVETLAADPAKVKPQATSVEQLNKLIASVSPGAAQAAHDHDE